MNIDFRSMLVVMRKELRDFYRDRRTFLMTLLLSPILFPAIMLGMFKLMENRASTQLEKDMTIPVAGSEHAPNLLAHLASHGIAAAKCTACWPVPLAISSTWRQAPNCRSRTSRMGSRLRAQEGA